MKFRILSATALAALSTSAHLSALAQSSEPEDSRRLEVVTVTTQKQEQAQIDVPINISVASQDLIDKLAADDIEDLANFIPGLQVQAQSLNAPTYSLRGVVADGGAPRSLLAAAAADVDERVMLHVDPPARAAAVVVTLTGVDASNAGRTVGVRRLEL
jgi:outer membrane receptor protein involved in Fe transport